jgi:hypothetical protein
MATLNGKRARRTGLIIAAATLLGCSMAAVAHHSFAAFDMQREVTVKGKIVAFKWTNPHSWIEMDVAGQGSPERWTIEMTSPNNLVQVGWKRTTVKPGDSVTLVLHPLRDGGKGGTYVGIRLPDGTKLGEIK